MEPNYDTKYVDNLANYLDTHNFDPYTGEVTSKEVFDFYSYLYQPEYARKFLIKLTNDPELKTKLVGSMEKIHDIYIRLKCLPHVITKDAVYKEGTWADGINRKKLFHHSFEKIFYSPEKIEKIKDKIDEIYDYLTMNEFHNVTGEVIAVGFYETLFGKKSEYTLTDAKNLLIQIVNEPYLKTKLQDSREIILAIYKKLNSYPKSTESTSGHFTITGSWSDGIDPEKVLWDIKNIKKEKTKNTKEMQNAIKAFKNEIPKIIQAAKEMVPMKDNRDHLLKIILSEKKGCEFSAQFEKDYLRPGIRLSLSDPLKGDFVGDSKLKEGEKPEDRLKYHLEGFDKLFSSKEKNWKLFVQKASTQSPFNNLSQPLFSKLIVNEKTGEKRELKLGNKNYPILFNVSKGEKKIDIHIKRDKSGEIESAKAWVYAIIPVQTGVAFEGETSEKPLDTVGFIELMMTFKLIFNEKGEEDIVDFNTEYIFREFDINGYIDKLYDAIISQSKWIDVSRDDYFTTNDYKKTAFTFTETKNLFKAITEDHLLQAKLQDSKEKILAINEKLTNAKVNKLTNTQFLDFESFTFLNWDEGIDKNKLFPPK